MKKEVCNINKCSGCGACVNICPQKCIELVADVDGFYVARKDMHRCIDCGKCNKICPVIHFEIGSNIRKSYIAVSRYADNYTKGASGGIVPTVSQYFLRNSGIVWGCKVDTDFNAKHTYVSSESDLDSLCRSKYIQSYIGDSISEIRRQLEEGKKVLFVGTPCQVAGIRKIFGKEKENLFLIDVLCHGVPSAKFFKDNIAYVEKKKRKKLNRYEFRLKHPDKKNDDIYEATYIYRDGTIEKCFYYEDVYFAAFYNNMSLSSLCYECPFACENRGGDLSVGDYFWGKQYHENFAKYTDTSCVLVNSEKGEELLEAVASLLVMEETQLDWIKERNKTLIKPTGRPKSADRFYLLYRRHGFSYIKNKYYMSKEYLKTRSWVKKIRRFINH